MFGAFRITPGGYAQSRRERVLEDLAPGRALLLLPGMAGRHRAIRFGAGGSVHSKATA